jgi:hypothetical protein
MTFEARSQTAETAIDLIGSGDAGEGTMAPNRKVDDGIVEILRRGA